jgi:hypothetical protein
MATPEYSITLERITNVVQVEMKYSNSEPCRHYVSIGRIHSHRYDKDPAQSTATQKTQHPALTHLPVVYSAHTPISTTSTFMKVYMFQRLTECEVSVDVLDALREIDIGREIVSIRSPEIGT